MFLNLSALLYAAWLPHTSKICNCYDITLTRLEMRYLRAVSAADFRKSTSDVVSRNFDTETLPDTVVQGLVNEFVLFIPFLRASLSDLVNSWHFVTRRISMRSTAMWNTATPTSSGLLSSPHSTCLCTCDYSHTSYDPSDASVSLTLNGEVLGRVYGKKFSEVLFSVWFGASPFMKRLRDDILSWFWSNCSKICVISEK